ncbi:putative nucleic acid-binding protein [Nocardioides daedukensis]|uniref:Ribonuclease VapC n=1 Tax=Nocardioides daedukensis TaxID=634462 RepID=A0A7Y9RVK8_9ACTN|nr:type II toxin-antitoxin system VapC family toxin [Nocardioides daedukensis]NYG57085.1 putative nucleic acid-binding protein [Nocardioides daedukensis]
MIVLDTSVLVAALLGPAHLSDAIARRLGTERVVAPELVDIEATGLLDVLAREGTVSPEAAEHALRALATFPLERVSPAPLVARVWELRAELTAHDATFVALAESLGATLVTGDESLAKTAKTAAARCAVEVIG